MPKDLVQIIRDNPNCVVYLDNDNWEIHKISHSDPSAPQEDEMGYEAFEKWAEENTLATSENVKHIWPLGGGRFGPGNCYGEAVFQALATIVGVKIEPV